MKVMSESTSNIAENQPSSLVETSSLLPAQHPSLNTLEVDRRETAETNEDVTVSISQSNDDEFYNQFNMHYLGLLGFTLGSLISTTTYAALTNPPAAPLLVIEAAMGITISLAAKPFGTACYKNILSNAGVGAVGGAMVGTFTSIASIADSHYYTFPQALASFGIGAAVLMGGGLSGAAITTAATSVVSRSLAKFGFLSSIANDRSTSELTDVVIDSNIARDTLR